MNKTTAHCLLFLFDLAALLAVWWTFSESREIYKAVASGADMIEYNNRMYFMLAGGIIPFVHTISVIEALRPKALSSPWAGKLLIGFFVLLLVSAFGLSLNLDRSIQKSGYLRCKKLDSHMSFSTFKVYVNHISVCEGLSKKEFARKTIPD